MRPAPIALQPERRFDEMTPYRELAIAVLEQARRDARAPGTIGALARAWLRRSEGLEFWAALAGIEPDQMRRVVMMR